MHVGACEEDMARVFRLGRRPDLTRPEATPRPLMVQFASYSIKNLIMESLYKLKDVDQRFRGINIAHDMTPNERSECKRLVAEAKRQQEQDTSGECLYRVRGMPGKMRIVTIRVRPRRV